MSGGTPDPTPWEPDDAVFDDWFKATDAALDPPLAVARKPWFKRPLGIAGIAICALILLSGVANASGGHGDTGTGASAATHAPGTEGEASAGTPMPSTSTTVEPAPKPASTFVVVHVVDGDTVRLDNGEKVRLVGIDTPEQGQCNYEAATRTLESLVLGKVVTLPESDEDRDRYHRLLRYVDVGSVDAGLEMLKAGLAIARYDSRDGYGAHPREAQYIATDEATPNRTCTTEQPAAPLAKIPPTQTANSCQIGYDPCLPVVADLDCADIAGPVRVTGNDPYRLDRDGDGIGCQAS